MQQGGRCREALWEAWARSRRGWGVVVLAAGIAVLSFQAAGVDAAAGLDTASAWSRPARAARADGATGDVISDERGLTSCLLGTWLHSYEDDTDAVTAYRPVDYPFPPARGRTGYEFLAGGYLIAHGIGPADEPTLSHGRWELIAPARLQIVVDEPYAPNVAETLDVVSCNADLLEVAR